MLVSLDFSLHLIMGDVLFGGHENWRQGIEYASYVDMNVLIKTSQTI